MGKKEELERESKLLQDLNNRLTALTGHLEKLNKEIAQLSNLEDLLIGNLKTLKKQKVIALAVEYKKAKNDLQTARNRNGLLKNDRENVKKAFKAAEKALNKAKESYEKLNRGGDNVVRGNFGRGNNG